MEETLTERGRPLRLRWWQKLAIVLQLQHREDGSLCWRVVVESGPRRIGKSVRLRAVALWRLANGPDLFEPEQLIVHTGKDLAIVREVMRQAWGWADPREDWGIKRGMTEPEVSYAEVNRWVARSKDATTGYDCCLALCDEAWDVKAASIDEDLEPSMLERQSPQLVLTSTAHRRATSLMRGRILDVLTVDDNETLILLWAAPPGSDPASEETWRAASPHWSEDRRKVIASKYAKALAGEADPEFDDPDPMQGWLAQYLNSWRLRERRTVPGVPLIEEDAWSALVAEEPDRIPDSAAIEASFAGGVTVAYAYRSDPSPIVVTEDHPDLASAAEAVTGSGYRGTTQVGASLAEDPALATLRISKTQTRTAQAVTDLARLLTEGALQHTGDTHLSAQVLAVRTQPGTDGARLVSKGRADAIKAATWAVQAARTAPPGRQRILLPN